MIEPLRLSFDIACDAEHAFTTWTSRTSAWWPVDHTVSRAPGLEVIFEPRVGGRIFERTPDGKEIAWGEVTAWEPPRRLGYRWHIAAERTDATDVEITFAEIDASLTRVQIAHHGWERLGAERGRARREANRDGWDGILPAYATACSA